MSAFLLGVGFRADMGTCARKLVLLKLIDACEDDGTRIFPAIATIARAAQCSTRQVQRELQAFRDVGLIRLVKEGGKGPRSTNEYALDLDILGRLGKEGWEVVVADAPAKGDTVSPLDTAEKGDTGDAERVTPETAKGDIACHPTPPDSSKDPSERASAPERERLRDEEGQDGGKPEAPAPDEKPGSAEFEKRVARLCNGSGYLAGPWHDWDTASFGWISGRFAALSPEDRAEAERWRDAYLLDIRDRKAKPQPIGVFLRDRVWTALDPVLLERADKLREARLKPEERAKPDGWAHCLGPVGMARFFAFLLDGPKDPPMVVGDTQLRAVWPGVADWQALLRQKGGVVFGPRWHALKEAMEPVPQASAVLAAWRETFRERGWPWLAPFDRVEVLYCPKGGPEGLGAFERALRGETTSSEGNHDDAGRPEAAE